MPSRRYPRKEEFGSTVPRCEWCGAEVYGYKRWLGKGEFDDGRVFCSTPCGAAGRIFTHTFMAVALSVFLYLLVSIAFSPGSWFLQNGNPSEIFMTQIISFTLFCGILYLVYLVRLGIQVRRGNSEEPKQEMVLHQIHNDILELVRTYPANEGVKQKIILDHMKEKGEPIFAINSAIRELVDGGYLKWIGLARYVIAQ